MKRKIPFLFTKTVLIVSLLMVVCFFVSLANYKPSFSTVKVDQHLYNGTPYNLYDYVPKDSFIGELTGYGPDCVGCGGYTGCKPNQNVQNGNIYYKDKYYGELRIIAADQSIACGTVVKLTAKIFNEPIYAIVLDRGGSIVDKKFDLLFESEKSAYFVGRQHYVKFDVLRYGW